MCQQDKTISLMEHYYVRYVPCLVLKCLKILDYRAHNI